MATPRKTAAPVVETGESVDTHPAEGVAVAKPSKFTHKDDLKTDATKEEQQAHKNRAMGEARSAALSTLSKNRRDELNALIVEEAAKRGYEWKPALTAEEKAEAEARELLEKFPHLKATLLGGDA